MRAATLSLIPLLLFTASTRAQNEYSRREYSTPGLVVEMGARTGSCDVLTFTPDGKYLLACGDDKVVRNWLVAGNRLETSDLPTLRWSIWRETRGNIYALALSPKAGTPEVAVAGTSIYGGGFGVAVIDRFTGKVRRGLKPAHVEDPKKPPQIGSIWWMEYNRRGDQLLFSTDRDEVWVWDLDGSTVNNPRRVIANEDLLKTNRIWFVAYAGADQRQAVAVDAKARVRLANIPARGSPPDKQPRLVHQVEGARGLRSARLSSDRKWLALAPEKERVEILSFPECQLHRTIQLEQGTLPHSLAFDRQGNRLAVGVRTIDLNADFLRERSTEVRIFDLKPQVPELRHSLKLTGLPDAVAFSPMNPNLIATAGGANHEVSLWELGVHSRISSTVPSPGRCIWGLGLSKDGRTLAFQDEPHPLPPSPNQRGTGRWRCFHLKDRTWLKDNSFQPEPNSATYQGWRLLTSIKAGPDASAPGGMRRADQWFVQGPDGNPEPLPWNRDLNDLPRCYTFLPPLGPGRPVRLAVGHYWGVSIYDLVPGKIRRTKVLLGHDANVTAIAASADGKRLVTAGRDMTINGWSLEDWPGHPTLGARFTLDNGKLMVTTEPALGSPLWEAGMSQGDEVLLLVINRKIIFNRLNKYGGPRGTAEAALEALRHPEAQIEHYFAYRRQKDGKVVEQLTTLPDRPLWRFFPTIRDDWVLWRWRDFYYDTGTTADHLIGWQRSFEIHQTPQFITAQDRSTTFLSPERVSEATVEWERNQKWILYSKMDPPVPELQVVSRVAGITIPGKEGVPAGDKLQLRLGLKAPNPENKFQIPDKVFLWINDHHWKTWEIGGRQGGNVPLIDMPVTVEVPVEKLRRGRNDLILQVQTANDNRLNVSQALHVEVPRPKPDLHVVIVAVNDYSQTNPRQVNLHAVQDAEVMRRVWQRQAGKYFGAVHFHMLRNEEVSQASVLGLFNKLAERIKTDDVLVFQLGGHGMLRKELAKAMKKTDAEVQALGLGRFLFLCPDFSLKNLRSTTISMDEIYQVMVQLPCVKVLLLDACRSGEAKSGLYREDQPLRILTQKGIGPVIIAACQPEQSAQELELTGGLPLDEGGAYGIFAMSLRKVLEEKEYFSKADLSRDQQLQVLELVAGVDQVMRSIVAEYREVLKGPQNIMEFVPPTLRGLVMAQQ